MVKRSTNGRRKGPTKKKGLKAESPIILPPKKYRLSKPKFIRDPIHDLIRFEDKTVLAILDTPPMQRLKGIRQLGVASFVYPGAEHSRFSHSLGVYHLASKMLTQIMEPKYNNRLIIQLAALLHDTGHGPFSHLFEAALKEYGYKYRRKHEEWTKDIIMNDEDVVRVLDDRDKKLKKEVTDVISGSFKPLYLSYIVSSQVDADRLDYMLRDSHMTGVHYGKFDINWMLRSLSRAKYTDMDEDNQKQEKREKLTIDARRGLSSLETYLLGLFYLYKHVYYHKTIQAAEAMLIKILHRALWLAKFKKNAKQFAPVLRKVATHQEIELAEYLALTDAAVWYWLSQWRSQPKDKELNDLCDRFLRRRLFKVVSLGNARPGKCHEILQGSEELLSQRGLDPKFYLILTEPERVAYKDLFWSQRSGKPNQEIYYLDENGDPQPFTGISDKHVISKAIRSLKLEESFLVVPEECVADIEVIRDKVMR